jgi:hypothetical protein
MMNLEEIRSRYGRLLWSTIYRVLQNHAESLDCYQDVFCELLERAEKAGGKGGRKRGQVQFVRSTRRAVPANWTCPLFRPRSAPGSRELARLLALARHTQGHRPASLAQTPAQPR